MDRVTMTSMAWSAHAYGILLNDSVDVPLRLGVVNPNLEATIENLEHVSSRLGCCYNELHNVFVVKMCFCGYSLE